MLMGREFGLATRPALPQQSDNQCGLQQQHNGDRSQLPAILLPDWNLTESDCAPGRQPSLPNAPAPELAPVELRPPKANGRRTNVDCLFAREQTFRHADRRATLLLGRDQRAAYDPLAEIRICVAEQWGVCDCMQLCEG